jgi:hypothetical protein
MTFPGLDGNEHRAMPPLVSVIIPTRSRLSLLTDAVKSVGVQGLSIGPKTLTAGLPVVPV